MNAHVCMTDAWLSAQMCGGALDAAGKEWRKERARRDKCHAKGLNSPARGSECFTRPIVAKESGRHFHVAATKEGAWHGWGRQGAVSPHRLSRHAMLRIFPINDRLARVPPNASPIDMAPAPTTTSPS